MACKLQSPREQSSPNTQYTQFHIESLGHSPQTAGDQSTDRRTATAAETHRLRVKLGRAGERRREAVPTDEPADPHRQRIDGPLFYLPQVEQKQLKLVHDERLLQQAMPMGLRACQQSIHPLLLGRLIITSHHIFQSPTSLISFNSSLAGSAGQRELY